MDAFSNVSVESFCKNNSVFSKTNLKVPLWQSTKFAETCYYEGAVRWFLNQGTTIDPTSLLENLAITWKMIRNRQVPVSLLIDITSIDGITSEGRDFFRTVCSVTFIDKVAISCSEGTLVQGNALSVSGRGFFPLEIFKEDRKACLWIRDFYFEEKAVGFLDS